MDYLANGGTRAQAERGNERQARTTAENNGSINGAEIDDGAITHEHAQYLRDKFLWGKEDA